MKIAIVVQGRFHAFDLGKALIARGHDVTLFTNYPKWAVRRFGFPDDRVRSFWLHGVIAKVAYRMSAQPSAHVDPWLNPLFGRWVSNQLAKERWDVIHGWSGVSEEIYARPENRGCLKLVMRGSAHIRVQSGILRDEERRTGKRLACPSSWIEQREQREYQLADRVIVLSTFARDSFVAEGVDNSRVQVLSLGTDTKFFRVTPDAVESRCRRILSGEPLRILYVGALSLQKGLWDVQTLVRQLPRNRFRFRLIGSVTPEARAISRQLRSMAEVIPKVPQRSLPGWYADSDMFLFPTLQDGYAVVLAQAQASGLPILTTPNCSGPDLIDEGETGWILPIRNPDAFAERLLWCDANRPALATMVRRIYKSPRTRSWDDVARDFEVFCVEETGAAKYQAVVNG